MNLKCKVMHDGQPFGPGSYTGGLPDEIIDDLKKNKLVEFNGELPPVQTTKIITTMSDLQKLDAKEIISAVSGLNEQQLIELNELEAADKGRKTVIKAIDEALSAE